MLETLSMTLDFLSYLLLGIPDSSENLMFSLVTSIFIYHSRTNMFVDCHNIIFERNVLTCAIIYEQLFRLSITVFRADA